MVRAADPFWRRRPCALSQVAAVLPEFSTPGVKEERAAAVRFYGVTKAGNSVMVHVHGFMPYFYVRAWPGFKPEDCEPFRERLNGRLRGASKDQARRRARPARSPTPMHRLPAPAQSHPAIQPRAQVNQPVLQVRPVQKQSVMHYNFGQQGMFLRIVTSLPSLNTTAKRVLEQGLQLPSGASHAFETFESNWAYVMRFMVDRDIVGMNWLSLTPGKWKARPWHSSRGQMVNKASLAQLEADVFFPDLVSHAPEGDWLGMAPMRILSFDIECAGRPGIFPDATQDPVIQIANHVCLQVRTGRTHLNRHLVSGLIPFERSISQ